MSAAVANPYRGRRIVVGVGGGIAAYKAAELVRLLVKLDTEVQVVMTEAGRRFIGELTFQALSGRSVFTDLWSLTQESEIGHIEAADRAELIVVAPATANLIARLAAGRASDALSAVVLASRAPTLVAPSMNVNMWEHPLTRANTARLRERDGVHVVGPGTGFLACRWVGPGRLAEPADIVEAGAMVLTPQDLATRRIVVAAGPTREPFDPVRFISNRSSGKMGYAIARAARRRGAAVELISGPVDLEPPPGVEVTDVVTAVEMEAAVNASADSVDVVVMVAAVADLRPASPSPSKLKKTSLGAPGEDEIHVALARNPDILAGLGERRQHEGRSRPLLVGFAAETEDLEAHARAKLASKRVDLIVANDVTATDAGFGADHNRVVLVDADGSSAGQRATKAEIAHQIWDRLAAMLAA